MINLGGEIDRNSQGTSCLRRRFRVVSDPTYDGASPRSVVCTPEQHEVQYAILGRRMPEPNEVGIACSGPTIGNVKCDLNTEHATCGCWTGRPSSAFNDTSGRRARRRFDDRVKRELLPGLNYPVSITKLVNIAGTRTTLQQYEAVEDHVSIISLVADNELNSAMPWKVECAPTASIDSDGRNYRDRPLQMRRPEWNGLVSSR